MTLGASFTPNQPSQVATPGAAANSLFNIGPCESVLVYNSGTVLVFAGLTTAKKLYAATPILAGGVPIPPGQMVILGCPNAVGPGADYITQVAVVAAAGSAGAVYVVPGSGTSH